MDTWVSIHFVSIVRVIGIAYPRIT
jgi:hypothetical protein